MSVIEAKKIVKRYTRKLKERNYPFSAVYMFGSYSKKKADEWSDIDVAVVSDKLKNDKNRLLLWKIRREVDTRIEPHGFTVKDFKSKINPLVNEIKKHGVIIEPLKK